MADTLTIKVQDDSTPTALSDSQSVLIDPGTAVGLKLTGLQAGVAGTAQTATVSAVDSYGNADPTYTGTVTFSGTDSQSHPLPAAQLPSTSPYTFVAANKGVKSFSLTLTTADTLTIKVQDDSTPTALSDSQSVLIDPGTAVALKLTGLQAGVAGTAQTATVSAVDSYGNADPTYTRTVTFSGTDSQSHPPPAAQPPSTSPHTFVAADQGGKAFH